MEKRLKVAEKGAGQRAAAIFAIAGPELQQQQQMLPEFSPGREHSEPLLIKFIFSILYLLVKSDLKF